jgi:hypothetical protein
VAYKHTTRDAVLRYLQMSGGRRSLGAIVVYMCEYHRVKPGTTRMMLQRLYARGLIKRPRWGYYQAKGVETGLDVEGNLPTT